MSLAGLYRVALGLNGCPAPAPPPPFKVGMGVGMGVGLVELQSAWQSLPRHLG